MLSECGFTLKPRAAWILSVYPAVTLSMCQKSHDSLVLFLIDDFFHLQSKNSKLELKALAVPGMMWDIYRYIHSSKSLNVRYEQRIRVLLTNPEEYIKGDFNKTLPIIITN